MPTPEPPTPFRRWIATHRRTLRVIVTLYAIATIAYGLYTALNGEPRTGWWLVATGIVLWATWWHSTYDAAKRVASHDDQRHDHP